VDPPAISRAIADQARTIIIHHMVETINRQARPAQSAAELGQNQPLRKWLEMDFEPDDANRVRRPYAPAPIWSLTCAAGWGGPPPVQD
jgi:hypothetical protein